MQGLCASVLLPCSFAATSASFPEQERDRVLALFGRTFGLGLSLDPVISSFIVATLSWRWLFFVNIPVAIAIFILAGNALPVLINSEKKNIDWFGARQLVFIFGGFIASDFDAAVFIAALVSLCAGAGSCAAYFSVYAVYKKGK